MKGIGCPRILRRRELLRSQQDLMQNLQLDIMLRSRSRDRLPDSLPVDTRLGWRVTRNWELRLPLKDLTDRLVLETYPEPPVPAIPLRRTFVVQWGQRF